MASVFVALAPENRPESQTRLNASTMEETSSLLFPDMLFTTEQRELCFRNGRDDGIALFALFARSVNRVSYLESRCYMLNTLLRDADFMSMSQGLEVRVPLIDHQLAKAVLALPGGWKLNGTPKKLLVEALAGSLPDEIVHRPKRGFTLPFERWMRQELRSEIEPVLGRTQNWRRPTRQIARRQTGTDKSGRISGRHSLMVASMVAIRAATLVRIAFVRSLRMPKVEEIAKVAGLQRRAEKLPVSVIVAARNEEKNLPRCLEALRDVGEVYVIDSGSTDATPEIARSFGAKVVQFHYHGGWPKKRQWAIDNLPLAFDWILLVDADEALTPELSR